MMYDKKLIEGYDNYSIDTEGVFRNEKNGILLAINYTKKGYGYVDISNKFGKKRVFAHRMVAKSFLNYFELCHVHHKDGNSKNNRVVNLECLTPYEHRKVSYELGHTKLFDKEIDQYSLKGDYLNTFLSIMEASRFLNLDFRNISATIHNKRQKSCGGFLFAIKGSKPNVYDKKRSGRKTYRVGKFKKSGELVDTYDTLHEAHIKSGVNKSVINSCVLGRSKPRGDFYWSKIL